MMLMAEAVGDALHREARPRQQISIIRFGALASPRINQLQ
jgi:hypothetical protein